MEGGCPNISTMSSADLAPPSLASSTGRLWPIHSQIGKQSCIRRALGVGAPRRKRTGLWWACSLARRSTSPWGGREAGETAGEVNRVFHVETEAQEMEGPNRNQCIKASKERKKERKLYSLIISEYQGISSVVQSCPTLCDSMDRGTPGLPVHHQLPEFTQTHVH